MDELFEELTRLIPRLEERGVPFVTIGAFAVRTYLARPDRRVTRDLDLVVSRQGFSALRTVLEEEGYRMYETGPWWRAERGTGEGRRVVDVAVERVVDMASFESYPITPERAVWRAEGAGPKIPVPSLEELLVLKLLAHRDKDMLDVIALLRDAGPVDGERFWQGIDLEDVEVPARRGYLVLMAEIRSGGLQQLWEDRFGEPLEPRDLEVVTATLEDLFR